MKHGRAVVIGVPALVLAVCLVASFLTRGAMANLPFLTQQGGTGAATGDSLVDQRPWQTVSALAPLAVSAEEQAFAREAERLADHEVDQAFAMALRQAQMNTRTLTGPALALQQKVDGLAQLTKDDQARVDALSAQADAATKRGGTAADSLNDNLDIAKAQLQLDTDELNDATEDLTAASGDQRTRIQQELSAREAAMKKYDAGLSGTGEVAVLSARRFSTLAGRIGGWSAQRSRVALLQEAEAQADKDAAALTAEHSVLERQASAFGAAANGADSPRARVAALAQMHEVAQIHSILDDRLQTERQLAAVYAKWIAQVQLQHRIVRHLILRSLSEIAAVVLVGVLVWLLAQLLLDRAAESRTGMDVRSLHTLRTVVSIGVEFVTLLIVLLVVFGAPSQVPTILGLATAGLTVVFQDFILAFFGWFILMGRNGIRVGDWVEINGVGGEVAEIGLFRTRLLETGNWTDKGHPTGRRVTFINNFAVTGQYFNFSTVGQWMWDEISVNVPSGEDTYKTIEAIHSAVLTLTEKDTQQAEGEWQTATRQKPTLRGTSENRGTGPRGLGQFSAKPSVDMRPAAAGIDILVRYVTRAEERFEMRNRLYQAIIDLLHTDGKK